MLGLQIVRDFGYPRRPTVRIPHERPLVSPRFGRHDAHSVTLDLPVAGWSSSVARWAHNPEVAGSNPVPATSRNDPRVRSLGSFSYPVATCLATSAFAGLSGSITITLLGPDLA
jgi:hypothetical protein